MVTNHLLTGMILEVDIISTTISSWKLIKILKPVKCRGSLLNGLTMDVENRILVVCAIGDTHLLCPSR